MPNYGIVCDNFKVAKFEEELKKEGFTLYTKHPFTEDSTTIKVTTTPDKERAVKALCTRVELHFKRSN